jgi:hypothetical protein
MSFTPDTWNMRLASIDMIGELLSELVLLFLETNFYLIFFRCFLC